MPSISSLPTVLLVGATGAFGERLARGLVRDGFAVIGVVRDTARLQALAQTLGPHFLGEPRDRNAIDAPWLTQLRAKYPELLAVVDASGPFQEQDYALPRAAMTAKLHYLDLADGRAFVTGISALDADARSAGVAVLSGASSTPALSCAVLDRLTADAGDIVAIDVAIAPGNRAPRGLSVVRSILSTVGQPIRVFRGGRWTQAAGWTLPAKVKLPGLAPRPVALCDTPDLDQLVARYHPHADAIFRAGLELPVLHYGTALSGLVVRLGLLRSLAPLSRVMLFVADLMKPFGSDRGGMRVDALLRDAQGALRKSWLLTAEAGDGPYIPTLPALAALKLLRDGKLGFTGAAPCAGIVPYESIAAEFTPHRIVTAQEETRLPPSLFRKLLGGAFETLPAEIKDGHDVPGVLMLDGEADVAGSGNFLGRLMVRVMRLPRAGKGQKLLVEMRANADGSETWTRHYASATMQSTLRNADPATMQLDECFGPIAIRLQWRVIADGLSLDVIGAKLFGIPLPRFLVPRSSGSERALRRADGIRFHFDVPIAMPLIGQLAHYRGWLTAR